MHYIAPLMNYRMRDVLVNVMFNHINRFKDDERGFLRRQMRDFFGLAEEEMPAALPEAELLGLYRTNLKNNCNVKYAADLAIPHPTHERTWFRLVIGGKHEKVLEVFRDVEQKIIGREAASIRTLARQKAKEERSGQLSFGADLSPQQDRRYDEQNLMDCQQVMRALKERLHEDGPQEFQKLWPRLLEEHHVTKSDIARLVVAEAKAGHLRIEPDRPRKSAVQDEERLSLVDISESR